MPKPKKIQYNGDSKVIAALANVGNWLLDNALSAIPIASSNSLGGIKVGQNLTIENDGTLNAQAGGSDVSVTPILSSGTKIAEISVSEGTGTDSYDIYAPTVAPNPSGTATSNLEKVDIEGTVYAITDSDAIHSADKGANNGVAELDANGKVPSAQLPSFVDDVVEGYYDSVTDRFYEEDTFTTVIPPTDGKSWVDITANKSYRWTGSVYVRVDEGVQLGTTHSTAAYGDEGATAYTHASDSGKISAAVSSGLYKIAATAQGHIAGLTAVQKSDLTALGVADANNIPTKTSQLTNDSGFITSYTDEKITAEEKNPTSEKAYNIPFTDGTTNQKPFINDGIEYRTLQGTSGSSGMAYLVLGNNTASGTAGNKYGNLRIYSRSQYYMNVIPVNNLTANRSFTLPDKSGTAATTDDIPTVNNSTITIKKNGTTVDSFTLNQSSNKNIDISVPTKTSDLTNDSGFVTTDEKITVQEQNPSSDTIFHIPFAGSTNQKPYYNNGIRYKTKQGTTSAAGYSIVVVGNSTSTGTAGNKYGQLRVYSQKNAYVDIITTESSTTNRTLTLPDATGTVALTSDLSSYLPLTGGTLTGNLNVSGSSDTSLYTHGSASGSWIGFRNADGTTTFGYFGVKSDKLPYFYDTTSKRLALLSDITDTNVTQTATSTNADYEVLFSVTADNTTRTEGARKNSNLKFNPSTGNLKATQLNGVTIGSSPKFTDNNTTYSMTVTGQTVTLTPSSGTAQSFTLSTLINGLSIGNSTPVDADYYVSQYVGGGTQTVTYHRRPMSALYAYIKGKTDSVYAPLSHTHGNIQNGGTLQTTDVAIASGDKLVICDSSDSNKIARSSLAFTSNTSKFLREDGTWQTVTVSWSGGTVSSNIVPSTAGGCAIGSSGLPFSSVYSNGMTTKTLFLKNDGTGSCKLILDSSVTSQANQFTLPSTGGTLAVTEELSLQNGKVLLSKTGRSVVCQFMGLDAYAFRIGVANVLIDNTNARFRPSSGCCGWLFIYKANDNMYMATADLSTGGQLSISYIYTINASNGLMKRQAPGNSGHLVWGTMCWTTAS